MDNAVYCVARDRSQAESIVDDLKNAGFRRDEISVLMADKSGTKDFAEDKDTKAPEGAATGAGAGVGVGAVLGWLAGIGSLAIPGVGPLIAAGPIMGALGGAAVGGAAGGIIGGLVGMGIPEDEAKEYDEKVRSGGVMVSVHTDDPARISNARDVFERVGADGIRSTPHFGQGGNDTQYRDTTRPLT